LTPHGLGIAFFHGRLRPRLAQHELVQLDAQADETGAAHGDVWKSATAALARWLQNKGIRDIPIRFVVSAFYTRFALLPWPGAFARNDEVTALMLARFSDQYGDMKAWKMCQDQAVSYGMPTLAFAMPAALIADLSDICKQYRLACRGIQPAMAASWNQWKHAVARFPAIYAVAEGDMLVMAAIEPAKSANVPGAATPHWSAIRAMKLPDVDLENVLHREVLLNGLTAQTSIFLDARDPIPAMPLSNVTRLARHELPDGIAGMAVAGVNW
jgi:hypothetical protein